MKLLFDLMLMFFGATIMYLIITNIFSPFWFLAVLAWLGMSIFYGLKLGRNPAVSFWAGFLWMPCMLFPPRVFLDICTKMGFVSHK